jgi:hydroxyacylglutathione hydrolase
MARIWPLPHEGLSNSSYLAEVGEGLALAVATDHIPNGSRVLDVRQHTEWASGHLPGALHAELGTLVGPVGGLPEGPVAVMCGHGERAMTGASLLAAAGAPGVSVLRGGPGDWAKATGQALGHE